ncbi:hypothetical protein H8E07_15715, partial [bacterium]|nr:hypothetical protein [bacterium]
AAPDARFEAPAAGGVPRAEMFADEAAARLAYWRDVLKLRAGPPRLADGVEASPLPGTPAD